MEKTILKFPKNDSVAYYLTINKIEKELDSAYMTVKENHNDTEPLIKKSLGAGISLVDNRLYKNQLSYKIQLDGADTQYMEVGVRYFFDIKGTIGNAQKTFRSGELILSETATGYLNPETTNETTMISDVLETDFATGAQSEYVETEVDPVAMKKIGDMTKLGTTEKGTIVGAVNEVVAKNTATQEQVTKVLNGTTPVPKATDATNAVNAENATNATNSVNAENTDFTNAEWTTITSDSYEDISDTDFRRYKFSAPLSENLQRETLEITVQDQNGVLPILSLGVAQMPKVTGNTAKNKKTMVSYQRIYLHAAQTKVQTFNVVFESLDTGVAGINVSILSDYKVNVAFELSYRKIR